VRASDCCAVNNVDHFCTAKRGEVCVKQFAGERDFDVLFAIDGSSSQMFGSALSKIDFALKLAEKLGDIARKVGDRVGLLLFSEDIELYEPPCPHPCVPNLSNRHLGQKSNPCAAVKFLQNMLRTSSIVFFVSDFLYPDRIREHLLEALKTLSKRHDLICVQLADRIDVAIPPIGRLRLQDAESLDCVLCNSNDRYFSNIHNNIDIKWASKLHKDAERAGLKFITIRNGCNVEAAIKKCLNKRLAYA
jgi:uncharacterized protein (DUF58 family)